MQLILDVLGRLIGSHRPDFSLFAIWAQGHKRLASIYLLMYNLHCVTMAAKMQFIMFLLFYEKYQFVYLSERYSSCQ